MITDQISVVCKQFTLVINMKFANTTLWLFMKEESLLHEPSPCQTLPKPGPWATPENFRMIDPGVWEGIRHIETDKET